MPTPRDQRVVFGVDVARDGAVIMAALRTDDNGIVYTDLNSAEDSDVAVESFAHGGLVPGIVAGDGPPAGLDTGYVLSRAEVIQLGQQYISDEDDDEYVPLDLLEDDEFAAPAAADGDILARIDALTADLCACGCRRAIPPNGASTFYATPGCQRRWLSQHTQDADDVYRRRDAAAVYVAADHREVPLQEADGRTPTTPRSRGINPTGLADARSHDDRPAGIRIPPCPDDYGAAYRRFCNQCDQQVIPDVYTDDRVDIHEFGNALPIRSIPAASRHECPHCHTRLPDPAYTAHVTEADDRLILELHDDTGRARHTIGLRRLRALADPRTLIDLTWHDLERQLGRFRRAWLGSRGSR